MKERLYRVFRTLLLGAFLWLAGAFITAWGVHTVSGLAYFYLGGGYAKEGLSLLEALLRFPSLLVQAIVGLPFLCGYLLTWGVLRYWYLSGIASLYYYLVISDTFHLSSIQQRFFLVVCIGMQIAAYLLIGNRIDYRAVLLYEHILFYIVPMVTGMLLVFGYAQRWRTM
jgi:hypothetical protein